MKCMFAHLKSDTRKKQPEHEFRGHVSESSTISPSRAWGLTWPLSKKVEDGKLLLRASSQPLYASPSQTVVVVDWDDTLFPKSFLYDKLRLSSSFDLAHQLVGETTKNWLRSLLQPLSLQVADFLRSASALGQVVVIAAAEKPWVADCCASWLPGVADVMKELNAQVVYAEPRDATRQSKVQAITEALERFYSKYEGQSWKNVISVGDSLSDRSAMLEATRTYLNKEVKDRRQRVSTTTQSSFIVALAEISAAALIESSAKVIQRIWRGHMVRRHMNLLSTLRKVKELAGKRGRSESKSETEATATPKTFSPRIPAFSSGFSSSASAASTPPPSPAFSASADVGTPALEPLLLDAGDTCTRAEDGHFLKVRTKTFTMVDGPLIEELCVQLQLLASWLPIAVHVDRSFDVQLGALQNAKVIEQVEDWLLSADKKLSLGALCV